VAQTGRFFHPVHPSRGNSDLLSSGIT